MVEIVKVQIKRRMSFDLRHPSGPKVKELSQALDSLPSRSPVLFYRESQKKWEGIFPIISVSGETVVIQFPSGRRIYRATYVRPVNRLPHESANYSRSNGIPRNFHDAREKENRVLINNGTLFVKIK